MSKNDTNPHITAALCFLRDQLNKQAEELVLPAEAKLKAAKAEHHDAVIASNRLKKEAQRIQNLITTQMQQELDDNIALQAAYEYKQDSSNLINLLQENK
jgi:hypothetical protein